MLRLRKYKTSDAQVITKWLKNEYAFRQWSADRYESYPITADDMNQYYSQYNDDALYILTAIDENEITGHITIRFIDDARKVARLGFVIVDDSKRGKGYGKQLVSSALNYTFNELKADKAIDNDVSFSVMVNGKAYKLTDCITLPFCKENQEGQ